MTTKRQSAELRRIIAKKSIRDRACFFAEQMHKSPRVNFFIQLLAHLDIKKYHEANRGLIDFTYGHQKKIRQAARERGELSDARLKIINALKRLEGVQQCAVKLPKIAAEIVAICSPKLASMNSLPDVICQHPAMTTQEKETALHMMRDVLAAGIACKIFLREYPDIVMPTN